MSDRRFVRGALCVAAVGVLLAVGCTKPPPPKPPPSPPAVEEPPPPPPPPPKCESMDEACVAKPDTRARITTSGWTVRAPEGWTYAQEEAATVATSKGAALAVTAYETTGNGKKDEAARNETLAMLITRLEISFPKAKKKKVVAFPKKVQKTIEVGTLKVGLVQLDGASRDASKGPLLAFDTRLPEGKALLGVGFVPNDDDSNADAAILESIESLAQDEDRGEKEEEAP
jgi:hypothetical protein